MTTNQVTEYFTKENAAIELATLKNITTMVSQSTSNSNKKNYNSFNKYTGVYNDLLFTLKKLVPTADPYKILDEVNISDNNSTTVLVDNSTIGLQVAYNNVNQRLHIILASSIYPLENEKLSLNSNLELYSKRFTTILNTLFTLYVDSYRTDIVIFNKFLDFYNEIANDSNYVIRVERVKSVTNRDYGLIRRFKVEVSDTPDGYKDNFKFNMEIQDIEARLVSERGANFHKGLPVIHLATQTKGTVMSYNLNRTTTYSKRFSVELADGKRATWNEDACNLYSK